MHFDFSALSAQTVYNVLTSTVTPRPIAWLTTLSGQGVVNAAPFSFFNVMGHQPPTVAIGLMRHSSGELKDSSANIIENGEFVVNLVPEPLIEQMNQTCADYPADVDELAAAGLTARPARSVAPPLIDGASPAGGDWPGVGCSCVRCLCAGRTARARGYPGDGAGRAHAWRRLVRS